MNGNQFKSLIIDSQLDPALDLNGLLFLDLNYSIKTLLMFMVIVLLKGEPPHPNLLLSLANLPCITSILYLIIHHMMQSSPWFTVSCTFSVRQHFALRQTVKLLELPGSFSFDKLQTRFPSPANGDCRSFIVPCYES